MTAHSITGTLLGQSSVLALLGAVALSGLAFYVVYRLYLDELSHIPGPLSCRCTILWSWYHSYIGDECSQIDKLHLKYGPVVRIGPREVVFSDGEALAPVYTEKGGFLKAPCYANFDLEGHATIFSSLDPKHRSERTKAVMPMFSTASLRGSSDVVEGCVTKFIRRLEEESNNAKQFSVEGERPRTVDVLNLGRSLALDTVCSYLFGQDYGGVEERSGRLSASSYVSSIVAFGNMFFLPKWLFDPILEWSLWLWPSPDVAESERKVADFTNDLVQRSIEGKDTYQERLLHAGMTAHETDIQMKDVIFAGTDSTGTNLSTLMWRLAKHPEVYRKVQEEVAFAEKNDPDYDPQKLVYLQAVIREGLRMSLATPTRFPRQVPPGGWTFTPSKGERYYVPAGAQVGLSSQTLHFNPEVFSEPMTFNPERWINNPSPEMYRDWIPFNVGARQCIARNLAMMELTLAVRALAKSDVLSGARPVQDEIKIMEWFNAKIIGETIDLAWA